MFHATNRASNHIDTWTSQLFWSVSIKTKSRYKGIVYLAKALCTLIAWGTCSVQYSDYPIFPLSKQKVQIGPQHEHFVHTWHEEM